MNGLVMIALCLTSFVSRGLINGSLGIVFAISAFDFDSEDENVALIWLLPLVVESKLNLFSCMKVLISVFSDID